MSNLSKTVYTHKLVLKDNNVIRITQEQYDAIIPAWANKEHKNIYLQHQDRWLDTYTIKEPVCIASERKKREASYFTPPEEKPLSEEERKILRKNVTRFKTLKKYFFEGVDKLSNKDIEILKEHYKEIGILIKEQLQKPLTEDRKKELEKDLQDCRNNYLKLINK